MSETAVQRQVDLEVDPERVWEALTDESLLERWLAARVELDPCEGGRVRALDEAGRGRTGFIERIEEPAELVLRWADDDGVESRVIFRVDAVAGGSRLIVTETVAAGPQATMAALGWEMSLALLARALFAPRYVFA